MDLRKFLPHVKTCTLRETASAAGLVAVSAGAGYCSYRSLRGGSAPPEHTQPPHEPEDVLEDGQDTPSVLQVVELHLQLLPTEPCSEPSAVVLDVVDVQLASEALILFPRRPYDQESTEAELFRAQVLESNLQLLPFEPHHEASAVVLPLDAGELISTWRDVQFLSADYCGSQFGSVLVKRYFLGMMRGPKCRLCWFKTTETRYLNDEGFPYHSITEDSFTAIQGVLGRVTEFISCNRVEDSVSKTLDYLQTFKKVTCTYLHVGADDQVESLIHNKNFLFLVGKKIVMQLAAANNQDHLTALCEVLFSQPMELYSVPAALASPVLSLLRQHIKTMMDDLERL